MSAAPDRASRPAREPASLPPSATLDAAPHPYALLAERAKGICLLARLWAQSGTAPTGVRPSAR